MKTTNISEIEKNMVVLDSGATNGVCPFEELCFNIRKETNNMDCGGGNNMSSKLVGDMLIKGRGKDMKSKLIKVTKMFIDPKSKYTILSSTRANVIGGFEIIQRGSVHMLVNKAGDNIVFNKVYTTKNGYLICCEVIVNIDQYNLRVEKKMDINKAHRILTHASPDTCRFTSKELG